MMIPYSTFGPEGIMPSKRSSMINGGAGLHRSGGSGGFRFPVAVFLFICALTPLGFLASRIIRTSDIDGQ